RSALSDKQPAAMRLTCGRPQAGTPQISGGAGSLVIKGFVFTFAIVGAHKLAQRIKRVVGNSACPHQLPQSFHCVAGETTSAGIVNFGKEPCPLAREKFSNFFRALGVGSLLRHGFAGYQARYNTAFW